MSLFFIEHRKMFPKNETEQSLFFSFFRDISIYMTDCMSDADSYTLEFTGLGERNLKIQQETSDTELIYSWNTLYSGVIRLL